MYAFKAAHQLRLPRGQFYANKPLPWLRTVLAALDPGLHPLEVAGFMTTPQSDLEISNEVVAPCEWLLSGGGPAVVAHWPPSSGPGGKAPAAATSGGPPT